jgi:hypothetical protein
MYKKAEGKENLIVLSMVAFVALVAIIISFSGRSIDTSTRGDSFGSAIAPIGNGEVQPISPSQTTSDTTKPVVKLLTPPDGATYFATNGMPGSYYATVQLQCSATDNALSKVELWINKPSGWAISETRALSGTGTTQTFSGSFVALDGYPYTQYAWNCKFYDTSGNYDWGYTPSGGSPGFKVYANNTNQTNITSCTNECSPLGATGCSDNYARVCGNYDNDPCLEWNTGTYCTYGCYNGACSISPPINQTNQTNTTPTCTDSDGGQYPNVYGYTTGKLSNGGTYWTYDQCSGGNTAVLEAYCSGSLSLQTVINCASGRICSNGACVVNNQTNITDTTPPTVTLLAPPYGQNYSTNNTNDTIYTSISCRAADNVKVQRVELYIARPGGSLILYQTQYFSSPSVTAYFSQAFSNPIKGAYYWNCKVYDASGNVATNPGSWQFNII